MKAARDVDSYIANAPEEVQKKLKELRRAIKSTAPQAEEKISYQMPYYGYKGRLIYFAYWKDHIAVYAMPASMEKYKKQVKKYWRSKATLHFPLNKKLPLSLIKKIVVAQIKANEKMVT